MRAVVWLLSWVVLVSWANFAAAADIRAPTGPAILTVVGGTAANRGPLDLDRDVVFVSLEVAEFSEAAAFDRAMLEALPGADATLTLPKWGPVKASGVRLDAVLSAAGVAEDATLMLIGLDGYRAVLAPEMRQRGTWVLATQDGGKPLDLGGFGPLWLLRDGGAPDRPVRRRFVWALVAIVVVPAGTTMPDDE